MSLLVILAGSILILGCEEQQQDSRRIRLIADENLKLKEQVKSCNQQIAKLQETIAEYEQKEQKRADSEKELGNSVIKLLQENDAATKEIEKLTAENLELKAKLDEFESADAEGDSP